MFKKIFNNKQILTILHNTLENEKTKNKVSNVSIKGEEYAYNQYSLLITMDMIIKYKIIINDDKYDNYFIKELEQITTTYKNHRNLVILFNKLLIEIVCKKLEITDKENIENQKQIINYIYDKYIVNGYCFHSFPSCFKSEVEENGLSQKIDHKEQNLLKKINYIFNNHNYKDIIPKNLKSKTNPIYITDSPAMAYYYGYRSPYYLATITSLSKYYENIKDYDKEAFYRKDYIACKNNLLTLCQHLRMSQKEQNTVIKIFIKQWNTLDISNSKPCIAFIRRKDLAKDKLSDIDNIISLIGKEDLYLLISKITDSKYPVVRRYSDIDPLDIKVITLPSYQEIKSNKFIKNEQKQIKEKKLIKEKTNKEIEIEETSEQKVFYPKFAYSMGSANLLALSGLFLITLGIILSIIINIVGG